MNITPINTIVRPSFTKSARKIAMAAVLGLGVITSVTASTSYSNKKYQGTESSVNYGKYLYDRISDFTKTKTFWGLLAAKTFATGVAGFALKKHKEKEVDKV